MIQYVLIRKDLLADPKWSIGSLIAQGSHACVAAVATTLSQSETTAYISDTANMTKTVLGVDDTQQLIEMSEKLTAERIPHYLWTEQPENIPTALATAPQLKSILSRFFKHLKLLK